MEVQRLVKLPLKLHFAGIFRPFKFKVILVKKNPRIYSSLLLERVLTNFLSGQDGTETMAQNGTAAGPSKLLNGKKKSAFKNEIHGGGKRYRCCDTGKLAVANPTYH